jgi:pyruvate dehydrogenase E2 component (dihydrolipoamide acetyltransferase)
VADFTMPSLGADMEEGTVLEWLVKPGDTVHKGDIVAVVDTAKAAVEVETFVDGVVSELLVPVGTKAAVGTPLARISGEGVAPVVPTAAAPAPAAAVPGPAVPGSAVPRAASGRPAPAPLVLRLAAELGVDLDTVTGTGPHGRITREDVTRAAAPAPAPASVIPAAPAASRVRATPYARRLAEELGVDLADALATAGEAATVVRAEHVRRAAARPVPAPAASARRPVPEPTAERVGTAADRQAAMRVTIGRLMARSKREIPHYYLSATVDLERARTWMQEQNRGLPVAERLVMASLLLKATALAARRHPELNGFWVDDAFVPGAGVHLGVAVSLRGGGLVAPAIHDADTLALGALMAAVRDLVGRARAGRLRGSEMTDPTLTVTNLGDQGVESVTGVIYPPQVALVGFGRVVERPWAVDGMLAVRPVSVLTLAADHRATDGFVGGRFLTTIDQLLQRPEEL